MEKTTVKQNQLGLERSVLNEENLNNSIPDTIPNFEVKKKAWTLPPSLFICAILEVWVRAIRWERERERKGKYQKREEAVSLCK